MQPPKCIAFADIRGDFKLLFTLLTQIFQVAKVERRKWVWTVNDTTLICLGNFTNRYGKQGYNRVTVSTEETMKDQIRVIETFEQLRETSKLENKNNNMVVLMGDHELSNLFEWSHYEIYQMAYPEQTRDQEHHVEFVKKVLKPFCEQQGVLASWGHSTTTVYFSHGSLDKDWFSKLKPKSLIDLNRIWQRWLRQDNFLRLGHFGEPNSPVMSTRMALQPQLWRENDEDMMVKILGPDPNPLFVQAGLPIQILQHETWDPYMRPPKGMPNILASRNVDGTEQFYFINNAMADVFCVYEDTDRKPQGLQFELIMNDNEEGLYLECKTLSMSNEEYNIYISERPLNSCAASPDDVDPQEIKLSEDELLQFRPMIDNVVLSSIEKDTDHIKEVALVLFSEDMKQVFVMEHTLDANQWSIPQGSRNAGESAWEAMRRVLREYTGILHVSFMKGGEYQDHQNTRIWVKQTRQPMTFNPNSFFIKGEWVNYDGIFSNRDVFLDRDSKMIFSTLLKKDAIPPLVEDKDDKEAYEKKLYKWKLYKASMKK